MNAHGVPGDACLDPQQSLNLLEQGGVQVVLCDLSGTGAVDFLQELRLRFPDVASVLMTGPEDTSEAIRAARACASDSLVKPVRADILVTSVHRAAAIRSLEREFNTHCRSLQYEIGFRTEQLEQALQHVERTFEETLRVLGHALELRDQETAGHCDRVARYSLELAKALDCTLDEIKTIVRGAYLHDIGKIGIDDAILRKPGPLTPEERVVMETHATIGYDMLRRVSFLASSAEIVFTHHERFDGTGYPRGLVGYEIPLGARIFAVADTLDALTSHRPYRSGKSYSAAREEILRESRRQFDPKIVEAFLLIPPAVWERIRTEVEGGRQNASGYANP